MQEMKKIISDPKTPDGDVCSNGVKKPMFSNVYKELKPLDIDIDSSKTDETKLNEILSLLHNITEALSSYEQIPLLTRSHEEEFSRKRSFDHPIMNMEVSDMENPSSPVDCQDGVEQPKAPLSESATAIFEKGDERDVRGRNSHRFSKETKSLRQEIDQAIKRKDALDEKLKLYISQRHTVQVGDEPKNTSKTLNLHVENETEVQQTLNAVDGQQFSSMADSEKSEGIEDLKRDEEVVLGLAESGLSEEINSLNNTIKEILKENQQYQEFFKDLSTDASTTNNKVREENFEKDSPLSSPIIFDDSKVTTSSPEEAILQKVSFSHEDADAPTGTYASIQVAFEAKIRSLVEAQEKTMAAFLREKLTSDERCRKLERTVAELKADEEGKRPFWEELIGVENCQLRNEFHISGQDQNDGGQTSDRSFSSSYHPIETHSVCQAHIEKLSQEKNVLLATLTKSISHRSSHKRARHNLSSSSLQITNHDVDCTSESCEKFTSLPTLNLISCDDVHHRTETSNAGTASLDDELHVLKSKVKFLETFLKKQYCESSSFVKENNSLPRDEVPVDTTDRSKNTCSESYFKTVDVSSKDSQLLPEGAAKISSGCLHEDVDSSQLYQKIIILLEEKEIMSNRLDELMAVTRELAYHYKNTKLELNRVLASQSDKRKNKRGSLNSGDSTNCSSENSASDNNTGEPSHSKAFSSKQQQLNENLDNSKELIESLKMQYRLNEKHLQERINCLQVESQKAWAEVQNKSLQFEKLKVDKEKLNYFLTSSLSNAEEENIRLQSTVTALREENRVLCKEMKTFKSCFDVSTKKTEEDKVDEISCITITKTEDKETQKNGNELGVDGTNNFSDVSTVLPVSDVNAKWQQSLSFLQKCLVEEKLQSQLLAAADMENSARVSVLRQAVREKGDMYQILLGKYQKLRHSFVSKKAEKRHQQDLLQECSKKMEELNSTTTAIEGNYKVMLSTLGHNIGIAVEILSSHLFFTPTQIHPSPELSTDPAFWFAAQCSRLRWLQSQLRKLCLHTWKTGFGTIPDKRKYSNKLKKTLSSEMKSQSLDLSSNDNSKNDEKLLHSLSPNSSMFSTLNDAEISLTNQQVKLAQSKTHQFNHLVSLLKEHAGYPSSVESVVVPRPPPQPVLDKFISFDGKADDDISYCTETESGFSNVTKDFSLFENEECPSPVIEKQQIPTPPDKYENCSMLPTKLSRPNDDRPVDACTLESLDSGSRFTFAESRSNVSQEKKAVYIRKLPISDTDRNHLKEVTDFAITDINNSSLSDNILPNKESSLDYSNENKSCTYERDRDLGFVHHKNHFITAEKIPVIVHREDH